MLYFQKIGLILPGFFATNNYKMYPNLSYILHALFGTEPDMAVVRYIQTFGLWMAIAVFVSAYFLTLEVRRKEREGIFKPILVKTKKNGEVTYKETMPHEKVSDIAIIAAVSGIIGAKIFAIFESTEKIRAFFQNPIGALFSGDGLAIYGGLILAFIVVYRYVKKLGIPPVHMMDAVAPSLIVGYGVGRIGCQLSGDGDWGIVNNNPKPSWMSFLPDWMWSFRYPHNVLNDGIPIEGCTWKYCHILPEPVYPTPFYETILAFIILVILWSLRKRIKIPGVLFFIYVFLNGVERWYIEKIRVNDKLHVFGKDMTQAELIALGLIILGIVATIFLVVRKPKATNPGAS